MASTSEYPLYDTALSRAEAALGRFVAQLTLDDYLNDTSMRLYATQPLLPDPEFDGFANASKQLVEVTLATLKNMTTAYERTHQSSSLLLLANTLPPLQYQPSLENQAFCVAADAFFAHLGLDPKAILAEKGRTP